MIFAKRGEKGSPKGTCPTIPVSKKVKGRMPFVRSMIWSGRTKSRGLMASWREPTAEKAITVRTPMWRRAAMLAREGTSWGAISWWRPWREMKAMGMGLPVDGEGWWRIVIGEEGLPQGVWRLRVATCVKPARD